MGCRMSIYVAFEVVLIRRIKMWRVLSEQLYRSEWSKDTDEYPNRSLD